VETLPTDDVTIAVVILGPIAIGTLIGALIWYLMRRSRGQDKLDK